MPVATTPRTDHVGQRLTVAQVAAMIDEPLYHRALSPASVTDGVLSAVRLGLAAVLCPPAQVRLAAEAVGGSSTRIATALRVDDLSGSTHSVHGTRREAEQALSDGARELQIDATKARLQPCAWHDLAAEIAAVAELTGSLGGLVRVAFDTASLTLDEVAVGARISLDSGAGMVVGGTWYAPHRATFAQIQHLRRAVGPLMPLKWTYRMDSLDRLLIANAEGVDRFNARSDTVLLEARERTQWHDDIRVPLSGVDY